MSYDFSAFVPADVAVPVAVSLELLTAAARSLLQPEHIPQPLKDLAQWTGWRYADKGNGKPTKPPINVRTGGNASTNNPATWSTFDAALAAFNADSTLAGLNFVLTPDDPIVAIDIDDYSGNDPAAMAALSSFSGTYAERSPSGGLHIFAFGKSPSGGLKTNGIFEVKRALTVTGCRVNGHAAELTEQQPAIDRYHRDCLTKPTNTEKNESAQTGATDFSFVSVGYGSVDYADRLRLALTNSTTAALYSGDSSAYGDDRSAAECALCLKLLTPADGRDDVITDWLNRSGCTKWLERDKDSDVYRRNTLAAAVKKWDGRLFEDKWESARQHGAALSAALLKNREPGSDDEPTPDTAEPTLTFCDLRTLRNAVLSPPQFIVNPLIPRGHLTLFGGHGGSGKTTVAFVIAAHVACGQQWHTLPVTAGKVLIASFEDGQELVLWRLKNIIEEYGLDFDAIESNLTVIDATDTAAIMTEVAQGGIRQIVATKDGAALADHIRQQQYDLVIIDNASDAFDGDENHRRQVRQFVRFCANAVKPHNGAIVLLAHIDKSAARYGASGNSYSGSTGWHNSARSRLALVDNELRQEKLNVGKVLPDPIPLVWTATARNWRKPS